MEQFKIILIFALAIVGVPLCYFLLGWLIKTYIRLMEKIADYFC